MKTRTDFGHRIDMLDREGEIVEHLAIILRQGARVIRDSRKPRLVK
jgi:hypothetical protein